MKKLISLMMVVVLVIGCLAGCAKLISTEYKTVNVIVTDVYYHPEDTIPIYNDGTSITWIFNPAVYEVKVRYKDVEYAIDGRDTYQRYKNREGETVKGTLEIRTYDDGTVSYDIIELE